MNLYICLYQTLKKLAAISLLGFLLFDLVGYYGIAEYLSSRSEQELQYRLDADQYQDSELVTFKFPLSLPYFNTYHFESIRGQLEFNGISYSYVKYRVCNDSLELKCIPNLQRTRVMNARDAFFKMANDFVNLTSKKSSGNHTGHHPRFNLQFFANDHSFQLYHATSSFQSGQYASFIGKTSSIYLQRQDKPPEFPIF